MIKHFPEPVMTGGLTGQGFKNLLGSPRLGLLPLVLREAAQNAWDARRRDREGSSPVRFLVRVRSLRIAEERAFREIFSAHRCAEPADRNPLHRELSTQEPVRVVEIADFGTVGLTGPTRPDQPVGRTDSRFINFFFDIGRAHVESGDGGTYGFGRSSLYLSGRAGAVIVDSLAREGSRGERRFMASRIGSAFEITTARYIGRYSGRHFWGREVEKVIQPLLDDDAKSIATRLGMPARRASDSGTTMLIPWPGEEFDIGERIAEYLLHNLWPKMVAVDGAVPMQFEVEVDGRQVEVPDPEKDDRYRLFVRALRAARTRAAGKGAIAIHTLRPRYLSGHLAVASGIVGMEDPIPSSDDAEEEADSSSCRALNRVALMRPSELVVRYLPVSNTELPEGRRWAGVFICNDDEKVRNAFAGSEPPAHDDWIADRLKERHDRYIVRKTVESLLPDAVREELGVARGLPSNEASEGPSLARASARFAGLLLSGPGSMPGDGDDTAGGGGGASGGRKKLRIVSVAPAGLEQRGGRRFARFKVKVTGGIGERVVVTARPAIQAEGRLDSPPEGMLFPTVVNSATNQDGAAHFPVALDTGSAEIDVSVEFGDEYGINLECNVASAGDSA